MTNSKTQQNNSQTNPTMNLLDWLARYWFLILFLGGMAVTWGTFQTKISTNSTEILVLKQEVQENDDSLNDLTGSLIRIETTLEFIKQKLDEQIR